MRFTISSKELLARVQTVSRVINKKNTNATLNNIKFEIQEDGMVSMTAACEDMTAQTSCQCDTEGTGAFTVSAKLLNEALKEIAEQPINFMVNEETMEGGVSYMNGVCKFPCERADIFPTISEDEPYNHTLTMDATTIDNGLAATAYAVGSDDIRPIMNTVHFDIDEDGVVMVASDGHKLIRYSSMNPTETEPASFSMPSKMVGVVRGIIGKVQNEVIGMEFNDRQVRMTAGDYVLVGMLTEGRYPNYNSVIPQDLPIQAMIERQAFISALRRVMVFANDASGLIALKIEDNRMTLNAEDFDFNSNAEESVACQYDGERIRIGFNGNQLLNVLSNINSDEVSVKLIDATRPGIFIPSNGMEYEELLALLMPMLLMDE